MVDDSKPLEPAEADVSQPDNSLPIKKASIFSEKYGVHWNIGVGLVTFLLGILVSYIFAALDRDKKQIAYASPTTPIKIFDSKQASPRIRVLDDEGQPIGENIYVTQITIWNSGNVEIEPTDVRLPIEIVMSPISTVVDTKIIAQTLPDVAEFLANHIPVEEASSPISPDKQDKSNLIRVDWKHFDPAHGFKLQVTFTSARDSYEESPVQVTGQVLGVPQFVRGIARADAPDSRNTPPFLGMIFGFALILPLFIVYLIGRIVSQWKRFHWSDRLLFLFGLLITLGMEWVFVSNLWSRLLFPLPTEPF